MLVVCLFVVVGLRCVLLVVYFFACLWLCCVVVCCVLRSGTARCDLALAVEVRGSEGRRREGREEKIMLNM